MIKHHPSNELLAKFSEGNLPATLSVAVAIHVEMCPVCQKELAALEAKNADNVFTESATDLDDMFDKTLFDAITADESIDEVYEQEQVSVDVKDKTYT